MEYKKHTDSIRDNSSYRNTNANFASPNERPSGERPSRERPSGERPSGERSSAPREEGMPPGIVENA